MKYGIYEQVVCTLLESQLLDERYKVETEKIEPEESPRILAKYLSEIIEQGLCALKDNGGDVADQIRFCNKIISDIAHMTSSDEFESQSVAGKAELLLALLDRRNSVHAVDDNAKIPRPFTSISQSSLFTGAPYEPSIFSEFRAEIQSCDRIDMLVSFIKFSGLRLIMEELREFTRTKKLRIITTSYMGATDPKAIEVLSELPNTEIRISYDTKRTRLHAKTYVYYRDSGYSTAYVGSSNMSGAAMSDGLEWNMKITAKDQPEAMRKIEATFETYWNSSDFVAYSEEERENLRLAISKERSCGDFETSFVFDITPFPFQREILDRLEAERAVFGHRRNLVVAATGTGKTVISAFDFRRFLEKMKGQKCNLLFVAHREEILRQSRACYRAVLRDQNFGELFVGGETPESLNHLFISIQTFNTRRFAELTSKDFYDYIVVDEFHHAAAPSYQQLLGHYEPDILLGLTATPERMDEKDIFSYFNNRIAAEIRLPEAIERKLLSTFQYFGVSDDVDLSSLKWSRGGYDAASLENVYTGNDKRTNMIVQSLDRYCSDLGAVKGLGFCVSKRHAEYMADCFNAFNIPSVALTADTDAKARSSVQRRLVDGELKFVFVVDIYNEGVDIPEINTILFLRPTESLTVFLQQLGRGLRLSEKKECLTVLDFIGQAHRKYSFEDKFKALLTRSDRGIQKEIKEGFWSLPRGCFISLEKNAREHILENIRKATGNRAAIVAKLASFYEDTGKTLSLSAFADHYHLNLMDLYSKESFSRLCVEAGVLPEFDEDGEKDIHNGLKRLCYADSRRWISFLLDTLPVIESKKVSDFDDCQMRMLLMFHYTIWQKSVKETGFNGVVDAIRHLRKSPVMFSEVIDLLRFQYEKIDFVDEQAGLGFDCPLDVHCSYTRDQILAAFDVYTAERMPAMREGVKFIPDKAADLLFVTLKKSDKDYSPSTLYNDYSISETLFHWQSQSTTPENSPTGQRYINHKAGGSKVVLFARENKSGSVGACAYTFLGNAEYVSHEGSRPMNIIWRLETPIPPKFYRKTNKLIAG